MKTREEIDLENMALAAELARQLCHEFSNFVHNLSLQVEIALVAPAVSSRENWDAIKREGKTIARLLAEWDRFHNRFQFSETAVDLHEALRQMARDLAPQDRTVKLAAPIEKASLTVKTSLLDCRLLLRLLIEDLLQPWLDAGEPPPAMSISTEADQDKAVVRIVAQEEAPEPPDYSPKSLMSAACRSLGVRLGATIRRSTEGEKKGGVAVEFPLT